jgi:type I restriction enzyme S subunit
MMAVDTLRETRHINRIRAGDLTELWTAQSYRPEITEALSDVRRSGKWLPLGQMCSQPIAQGRTPVYATDGSGYPCLKTKHINGLIVDDSEPDFVTAECASALARFKVATETVLMNRSGAGSIGRCSIYLGNAAPLTNEHVLHIRVEPLHDPCFAAAYLSTWWGERAIEQGITGSTGQLNLANEHVAQVPVPSLASEAQRYIGDKVRQAQRLRKQASQQRRLLVALLGIDAVTDATATIERRQNRVFSAELNPRLDAKYYGPRAMAVLRAASKDSTPVSALVEEVSNGFEHRDFVDRGIPYITVSEVSGGRLVLDGAPQLAPHVTVPEKARIDSRCALVVRTGSIGVAVKVFDEDASASISSHLIRLRCASDSVAAVLAAFLSSEAGSILQRKISYGAVQPQIGQEELLALPVPRVLVTRADAILRALETEDAALRAAARLVTAAKLLVEQLIEGNFPEHKLVAVQRALEAGDSGSDREVLGTLRRNGAACESALFPDIDALYALLDDEGTAEGGD